MDLPGSSDGRVDCSIASYALARLMTRLRRILALALHLSFTRSGYDRTVILANKLSIFHRNSWVVQAPRRTSRAHAAFDGSEPTTPPQNVPGVAAVSRNDASFRFVAECDLPTKNWGLFRLRGYVDGANEPTVVVKGDVRGENIVVRVHDQVMPSFYI